MFPIPRRTRVVLIVDEDLGLICWLGERLSKAGYQTLPALGSRQAALLVEQLGIVIDIIILSPRFLDVVNLIGMPGNGPAPLKIVLVPNPSPVRLETIQMDALLERPSSADRWQRLAWFRKLIRVMREPEVAARFRSKNEHSASQESSESHESTSKTYKIFALASTESKKLRLLLGPSEIAKR